MEVIPAIDLKDGQCVRLLQGDFNQKKVYSETRWPWLNTGNNWELKDYMWLI